MKRIGRIAIIAVCVAVTNLNASLRDWYTSCLLGHKVSIGVAAHLCASAVGCFTPYFIEHYVRSRAEPGRKNWYQIGWARVLKVYVWAPVIFMALAGASLIVARAMWGSAVAWFTTGCYVWLMHTCVVFVIVMGMYAVMDIIGQT